MSDDSKKKLQSRTIILPLPLWGLYQMYEGIAGVVRYFCSCQRLKMAIQGNAGTDPANLFGTHKDPFCADAAEANWRLLNDYRKSLSLRPLAHNEKLAAAARYMGKRMLQKNEFEHVLSDGVDLTDRIEHFDYRYSKCGENLAMSCGMEKSARTLAHDWHVNWINSPGHHANMIHPDWEEVGVAVVKSYEGTPTYYGVQNFGTPIW